MLKFCEKIKKFTNKKFGRKFNDPIRTIEEDRPIPARADRETRAAERRSRDY